MSILINKRHPRRHAGHHRQDRPVPHQDEQEYANGANCYVAGVNPKKAGEILRGHPIFASVKEAKQQTGVHGFGHLRAAPFAAAAIWEAGRGRTRPGHLHHRGHPGARHGRGEGQDAQGGKKTLLCGPNCPGIITPEEIKIGIMPGHIT
jgi:succinyl-CoA synthetase alpha subunit